MKNVHEVRLPDIGDARDVGVIEILVRAGDAVVEGQPLIIVETDKASMEIPSTHGGCCSHWRSSWTTKSARARRLPVSRWLGQRRRRCKRRFNHRQLPNLL